MECTRSMAELEKGIAEISAILETPDDTTDMEGLLLRTGQMFAEAEHILTRKRAAVLNELLEHKPGMTANEQKIRVEAECADEVRLARKIEQANKALGIIVANHRKI